jgi:endonuclease G
MKKFLALVLSVGLFCFLFPSNYTYADCRGCCVGHGGVVCSDGVTACADGTPLSKKCRSKACEKCDVESTAAPDPGFECNGHIAYGIPANTDQLLCRDGYAVGYDYAEKDPVWVAYHLTKESVNKKFKRSNRFREDTDIPEQYRSTPADYRGSGYDRGHMAAAATVDYSDEAMMQSFLMSNMTPQLPTLNRQGWRYLESDIRDWVNKRGELYVVTGAMFEGPHLKIGDGVGVPTHFFKVVYDAANQDCIAFIVPHTGISKSDLPNFIVSVNEVEARTGFDFNRLLDDALEDDMEDDVEMMW